MKITNFMRGHHSAALSDFCRCLRCIHTHCSGAGRMMFSRRAVKSAVVILPIYSGSDFNELLVQLGILEAANPRSGYWAGARLRPAPMIRFVRLPPDIFCATQSDLWLTGCIFNGAPSDRSDAREQHIDLFESKCFGDEFYIQCGYPSRRI